MDERKQSPEAREATVEDLSRRLKALRAEFETYKIWTAGLGVLAAILIGAMAMIIWAMIWIYHHPISY